MRRHLFFLTVFSLIIFSCKNEKVKKLEFEKQETEVLENKKYYEQEIKEETQTKTFDWTKTKLLKEKVLSELKTNNEYDKIIINFLNDYGKIEEEFNDILFDLSSYDSLNTIAYSPNEIVYENALRFKEKVEYNGFSIAQSEGMIFIAKNTNYIKSNIIELLDSVSVDFINLYCKEIDSVCCDDAAIIISDQELIERAFNWGNLIKKVSDLEYNDIVVSEFNSYLSLIFQGQDNTPSFDWETGKFKQTLFDSMTDIIIKFPKSKAAKEFKEFTDLLVSENFENSEKVKEFITEKFK